MGKKLNEVEKTILFCDGGSCQKAGSDKVSRAARAYLRNNGLWNSTHTIKTRCNGRCEDAPTCIVMPDNTWYKKLDENSVIKVLESHLNEEKSFKDQLLYEPGMDQVDSNDERPPFLLKPFEQKEDEVYGKRYETKGFSSDQYLFPLFLFLSQQQEIIKLEKTSGEKVVMNKEAKVVYAHDYFLELSSGEENLNLVIGSVGKNHPEEIQQQKISSTIYYLTDNYKGGIRFSNKKGELIASLKIENQAVWEYCLKIQLGNLKLPNFTS